MIKAIIGLGNEGAEYEKTYHNVGAFAAERIARELAERGITLKLYPIAGFMNESGMPIQAWLKMNNLTIAECVVAHDDSDLAIGSYKLVRGGGSAGHKGIESLVAHAGTKDFWRLRIGVRDLAEQVRRKAGEFVLERWRAADEDAFMNICRETAPKVTTL